LVDYHESRKHFKNGAEYDCLRYYTYIHSLVKKEQRPSTPTTAWFIPVY